MKSLLMIIVLSLAVAACASTKRPCAHGLVLETGDLGQVISERCKGPIDLWLERL